MHCRIMFELSAQDVCMPFCMPFCMKHTESPRLGIPNFIFSVCKACGLDVKTVKELTCLLQGEDEFIDSLRILQQDLQLLPPLQLKLPGSLDLPHSQDRAADMLWI